MPHMIDAVFDIQADSLPAAYRASLWQELTRHLPQLSQHTSVGVLPLRTSGIEQEIQLPKRSKLVLRIPPTLGNEVTPLVDKCLNIDGYALQVGAMKLREIQPSVTIHAHLVASADEEIDFVRELEAQLAQMKISCKWICGRHGTLTDGGHVIHGYSLVIHDLKPEDSLQLQYQGLGSDRHLGCGVFVPYKVITGLE
ncbi:MAG: type I-MYXAN CRISPR-associated protein Cas6/Cmx6 [Gallionella sp.]|nr:type I-MYXAN CRISPR-associated protein Cas6/Cmx6 [Gallionella sp.]